MYIIIPDISADLISPASKLWEFFTCRGFCINASFICWTTISWQKYSVTLQRHQKYPMSFNVHIISAYQHFARFVETAKNKRVIGRNVLRVAYKSASKLRLISLEHMMDVWSPKLRCIWKEKLKLKNETLHWLKLFAVLTTNKLDTRVDLLSWLVSKNINCKNVYLSCQEIVVIVLDGLTIARRNKL